MATVHDTTMRTLAIPLPGACVLHVALTLNADGTPADLCIGAGYASHGALRVLGKGVNVPADTIPALRDALAALDPT